MPPYRVSKSADGRRWYAERWTADGYRCIRYSASFVSFPSKRAAQAACGG